MGKNIKGTSTLAGKNVQNSESIGNLTADTIRANTVVATNATITNLTNTELQTATTNIATNTSNISTNTSNISTNTGNIATNTSDISTLQTSKQDVITAGTGLSFTGDTLNAEVTQAELDAKQDVITAGTGLSFTGDTLNAEVTQAELDAKQDLILDSTDIELNDLTVNDTIFFQRNNSTDTFCNIKRSTTGGKMRFNADGYAFKNETNGNNLLVISDSGTCTTVSVQADFFSGITNTELDQLDGITSNVQTQLNGKQATITSSTALSCASINLNSGDITNGGDGAFSTITLNGSDLQGKLNDKADAFGVLLPLEVDPTAFPNPALKLNYNTTQFEVDGDELKLTGNMGTIPVSGVTVLTCRSIELHNSTNNLSFLDFGEGDYRFRQLYNQTANTFTFSIDDAGGANPENKMQISRTQVNILNAEFDLNDNDIVGVADMQSTANIRFYVDGDTTGSANYTLDLKADGDADFNGGSLINVEAVESSNYPTTAILRMASFNTPNTNSTSSGSYGNDSYLNSFSTAVGTDLEIELGTSFVSSDTGIFTISEAGTFKITVSAHGDNTSVNDRVVLGFYISKNNDTAAWHSRADQFGMVYLRDDNFGQGGSCSFTSIRTLALNDTIRIKTKAGVGNNNWNETRNDGDVDVWANITFEKLF